MFGLCRMGGYVMRRADLGSLLRVVEGCDRALVGGYFRCREVSLPCIENHIRENGENRGSKERRRQIVEVMEKIENWLKGEGIDLEKYTEAELRCLRDARLAAIPREAREMYGLANASGHGRLVTLVRAIPFRESGSCECCLGVIPGEVLGPLFTSEDSHAWCENCHCFLEKALDHFEAPRKRRRDLDLLGQVRSECHQEFLGSGARFDDLRSILKSGEAPTTTPFLADAYMMVYSKRAQEFWARFLEKAPLPAIGPARWRVFDHGCGQGFAATAVLGALETIAEREGRPLSKAVDCVRLSDPVRVSVERAEKIVAKYNLPVQASCCRLRDVDLGRGLDRSVHDLHVFSEVLDVPGVDACFGDFVSKLDRERSTTIMILCAAYKVDKVHEFCERVREHLRASSTLDHVDLEYESANDGMKNARGTVLRCHPKAVS